MRKIKMAPINPVGPKVKYDKNYIRPSIPKQQLTEEVIRIYPPKNLGQPQEVEYVKCTPKAKQMMLERSHYSDDGVFIDTSEKDYYFVSKQEIKQAVQPVANMVPEFDHLTDTEYLELQDQIKSYLVEKNFSTKTILKDATIEEMIERYRIPNELLKSAIK